MSDDICLLQQNEDEIKSRKVELAEVRKEIMTLDLEDDDELTSRWQPQRRRCSIAHLNFADHYNQTEPITMMAPVVLEQELNCQE